MARISRRGVLRAGAGIAAVSAGAGAVAPAAVAEGGGEYALTGVNVVDVEWQRTLRERTVHVRGGRIAWVGRDGAKELPGVERIDCSGKFAIPGLIDAHVHSVESESVSPPLYLACGVTTVREMWGTATLRSWRDRVRDGELFGPRSIVAGPVIDGASSLGRPPVFAVVATPDEARRAVRTAVADGADFVKVSSRLPDELHRVVSAEARRIGVEYAGHCPDEVPLSTACSRGQRSFEHLYGAFVDMSHEEGKLREALAGIEYGPGDVAGYGNAIFAIEWRAVHGHDPDRAKQVLTRLARLRTTMVPTLSVFGVLDRPEQIDRDDERQRYVPAQIRRYWPWALEHHIKAGRDPEVVKRRYRMLEYRRELVGALYEAGVPVLAGTDAGDMPYLYPGFSLHDELAELVASGLTPGQALAAATVDAAQFLGLSGEIGTVTRGAVADLVLLNANPLTDIRNTTRIDAVVVRGRLVGDAERRRMLDDVAAAAAR